MFLKDLNLQVKEVEKKQVAKIVLKLVKKNDLC
jgi:hypothetical protein